MPFRYNCNLNLLILDIVVFKSSDQQRFLFLFYLCVTTITLCAVVIRSADLFTLTSVAPQISDIERTRTSRCFKITLGSFYWNSRFCSYWIRFMIQMISPGFSKMTFQLTKEISYKRYTNTLIFIYQSIDIWEISIKFFESYSADRLTWKKKKTSTFIWPK